jgi:hypothetical protein
VNSHIDPRYTIADAEYVAQCKAQLDADGALVLDAFFSSDSISKIIVESVLHQDQVFYANSTHNVYLTDIDPAVAADHAFNRQLASSKGLIADDQIPATSVLRDVYNDPNFRAFLAGVLGVDELHPYADDLSSINVHFAGAGQELGWHFDNSAFAVTMLLRAPQAGGVFEYVPAVRDADAGDMAFERVASVLDGKETVSTLRFNPGALVLFRGRDALHRVTPTEGDTTRLLVVFAYNDQPGVMLSESALNTFYGRTA